MLADNQRKLLDLKSQQSFVLGKYPITKIAQKGIKNSDTPLKM